MHGNTTDRVFNCIHFGKVPTALAGLLALFVLCASPRLDGLMFLEPDSPDYVIMSQSLVNDGVYRAPYDPSGALYSWRPPGLSLSFGLASFFCENSIHARKILVLVQTLAMLLVAYRLTTEVEGPMSGLVVVALLATNPNTLLWATEVVSEPLYALVALLVLWLAGASEEMGRARLLVVYASLVALPFIRTIGLVLSFSVFVWLILRHRARLVGLTMLSTIVPYAAWVILRRSPTQSSYFDFLISRARAEGAEATLNQMVSASVVNLGYLLRNLVPGGLPGVPSTSRVSCFPTVLPHGLQSSTLLLACWLLALCVIGLWTRRRESGGLVGAAGSHDD